MATHITRSSNSSPVAIKPGGSEQGRIGRSVEITVVSWSGNYARFIDPIVILDEENWIRGDYISELPGSPPPVTGLVLSAGSRFLISSPTDGTVEYESTQDTPLKVVVQ